MADRKPLELTPFLTGPLTWCTRHVLRYPRATLAIALAAAILASLWSFERLGFRTNRLDLLNPRSDFNRRWLKYLDEFGRDDDLVVVVESAESARLIATANDLAAELHRHSDRFTAVLHERNLSQLRSKGLYQLDEAQLDLLAAYVESCRPILDERWEEAGPLSIPRAFARQLQGGHSVAPVAFSAPAALDSVEQRLEQWTEQLAAVVRGRVAIGASPSPWAELNERFDQLLPTPLLLPDGQHALVALRLAQDDPARPEVRSAEIAALREILREVTDRNAPVRIGLTGMPVLEDDEMRVSQQDMTWASVGSMAGVILLLQLGFRQWRHTLLAVAILLVGMAWSFGYITLAIGHLNLLSVSFAAILIGLGIDFGIHYLARYLDYRRQGVRTRAALLRTAKTIGPGVVTGAVTTSVAFLCAAHTEFTGVAELGWIAGAGVFLCLLAALIVLPPLVGLIDRRHAAPQAIPQESRWQTALAWLHERPSVPLVFLAASGVASLGLPALRYDHNLLNLQTDGLESVAIERFLAAGDQRSVCFAVSLAPNRQEALRRKAAFEQLPSVAKVEELSSLILDESADAADVAGRRRRIESIHQRLAHLPARIPTLLTPDVAAVRSELLSLASLWENLQRSLGSNGTSAAASSNLVEQLRSTARLLDQAPVSQVQSRLAAWRQEFVEEQLRILGQLRELAHPEPPTWDDLPRELTQRFRGRSGQHLLRIYAREDVWEIEPLGKFVGELEVVDPDVTGHPVQTYYASRQFQRSYIHSGVYALICVLLVVYLDFRHFGHALLSMAPLVLSFLLTFGVAGWFDLPLNAANLLVLPLLLGIGIDNGVHVIHDWRSQSETYQLTPSVALSLALCSSTTIAGFCGLIFAQHAGLRSLGILLTLGMTLCLATSLLLLPAILRVFSSSASVSQRLQVRRRG